MANIHQRRRQRLARIRAAQAEEGAQAVKEEAKKAAPKKKTAKKTTKKAKTEK